MKEMKTVAEVADAKAIRRHVNIQSMQSLYFRAPHNPSHSHSHHACPALPPSFFARPAEVVAPELIGSAWC